MTEEEWRNSLNKGSWIAREQSLIYAEVMRLILLGLLSPSEFQRVSGVAGSSLMF